MKKYNVNYISGVAMSIGYSTKTNNGTYHESILATVFPDDQKIENWSSKESNLWQQENNFRLKSICEFLNKQLEL